MVAVWFRQQSHRRGEPRIRGLFASEYAVEHLQQKRKKEQEIGSIPLIRKTIRTRGFAKWEVIHHRRELLRSDGSRKRGKIIVRELR
jgi:hypothetical protein